MAHDGSCCRGGLPEVCGVRVTHQLWIPRPMPSLNELLARQAVVFKKGAKARRSDSYQKLKKEWTQYIQIHARQQEFPKLEGPYEFFYEFRELKKNRDPSNVMSGAVKLVEDALQEAGLLPNDGWKNVAAIAGQWTVDKERPGVLLTVSRAGDYDGS